MNGPQVRVQLRGPGSRHITMRVERPRVLPGLRPAWDPEPPSPAATLRGPGPIISYYYRPPSPLCPSPSGSYKSCCHLQLESTLPRQRPTSHSSRTLQELLWRQTQRLSRLQKKLDRERAVASQLRMEVDYIEDLSWRGDTAGLELEQMKALREETRRLAVEARCLALQLEAIENKKDGETL